MPDPLGGGRMHDRVRAAALFREKVGGRRWIEGWIEGPCAEAADLRGINRLMTDFFDDPAFVRDLFEFVLELGLRFGRAQVEAGVDMIGVGDAAASLVGPQIYEEFVLPYEKRLVDGLHALGTKVRLHICGNTNRILAGMGSLGCEIVDIDSKVSLAAAREAMGPEPGILRQYRSREDLAQRHAGDGGRGHRPMLCRGRAAVHHRRRLRSAPRHLRGKRPRDGPRPATCSVSRASCPCEEVFQAPDRLSCSLLPRSEIVPMIEDLSLRHELVSDLFELPEDAGRLAEALPARRARWTSIGRTAICPACGC